MFSGQSPREPHVLVGKYTDVCNQQPPLSVESKSQLSQCYNVVQVGAHKWFNAIGSSCLDVLSCGLWYHITHNMVRIIPDSLRLSVDH